MPGREVVEGEQIGAVPGQAFDGALVFHTVGRDEEIEGSIGPVLGLGHPLFGQTIPRIVS